ncbi:hypothetical protein K2P96_02250, partial [Patescibacteria group bacterium]|nr:hypothetical protein [Patescibacteria group bacterium]
PLRLIADATGLSPTGIQRYMMLIGMATSRATGVLKETRFANEELLNQTRIKDAEKASEEAWEIYEGAQARAGKKVGRNDGEEVSAEELKAAYLQKIPQDLQKRLADTSTANEMTKGLFRKHIEWDLGRLDKKIKSINDSETPEQEKKTRIEELVRSWEARLVDYDRVITQVGTVDAWAMSGRYAESFSKNAVRALTVQTLYLSVEKLFENIAHAVSGSGDTHEAVAPIVKDTLNKISQTKADAAVGHGVLDTTQHPFPPTGVKVDSLHAASTDTTHMAVKPDSAISQDSLHQGGRVDSLKTAQDSLKVRPDSIKTGIDSLKTPIDTTHAENAAEKAAAVAGGVKSTLETHAGVAVPHESIKVPTSFEIEKGPAGVSHALRKIVMDRILPTDTHGVTVDKVLEARNLNITANLEELMKGHDVAGIKASEIQGLIKVDGDKLRVDPKAYGVIDHLFERNGASHFTTMFENDPSSAGGYVGNENWASVVHADGMHEGFAADGSHILGIDGRPDITSEQIYQEASHAVENNHAHAIDEARKKVMEGMGGKDAEEVLSNGTKEFKGFTLKEFPEGKTAPTSPENVLDKTLTTKVAPEDVLKGQNVVENVTQTPATKAPHFDYPPSRDVVTNAVDNSGMGTYKGYNYESANASFARNNAIFHNDPSGPSGSSIIRTIMHRYSGDEIRSLSSQKLHSLFEDDKFTKIWTNGLRNGDAVTAAGMSEKTAGEGLDKFVHFIHRLQEVSGVDPRGKGFLRGAETNEDYIQRALKVIGKMPRAQELIRKVMEQ